VAQKQTTVGFVGSDGSITEDYKPISGTFATVILKAGKPGKIVIIPDGPLRQAEGDGAVDLLNASEKPLKFVVNGKPYTVAPFKSKSLRLTGSVDANIAGSKAEKVVGTASNEHLLTIYTIGEGRNLKLSSGIFLGKMKATAGGSSPN